MTLRSLMSAWHLIVKHLLAVSGLKASYIRTNAEQKISFFCNLHPKSLHAGMQLVTRESKGQLLVKLLRTDFFQKQLQRCLSRRSGKFCSLRIGLLLLSFEDPLNQGRSIFGVFSHCLPISKPLKETIRRQNGIKVACKNVAFNLD